jgi:hypothetical protein
MRTLPGSVAPILVKSQDEELIWGRRKPGKDG